MMWFSMLQLFVIQVIVAIVHLPSGGERTGIDRKRKTGLGRSWLRCAQAGRGKVGD